MTSDRRVLVVGGLGYVGNVLMRRLLDKSYSVRCADLAIYENSGLAKAFRDEARFEYVPSDVRAVAGFDRMLDGATDLVLLAGLVGDPISKKYPLHSRQINVEANQALIEAARGRGVGRLIFVSTCSNYGLQTGSAPAAEDAELKPLSVYAENKVAVERFLLGGSWDFPFTILRFATAFGLSPRMRFDLTVSEFTRELYLGRELVVYDADTWRPYCHVRDLSEAVRHVLEAPAAAVGGQVFNVGGDAGNHTKRSIVEIVRARIPGARVRYREHGSDSRNYRVDFSKIRATLGFEPRFRVADGVEELLAALARGEYADADARPNFHGNRQIPLFDAEGNP